MPPLGSDKYLTPTDLDNVVAQTAGFVARKNLVPQIQQEAMKEQIPQQVASLNKDFEQGMWALDEKNGISQWADAHLES